MYILEYEKTVFKELHFLTRKRGKKRVNSPLAIYRISFLMTFLYSVTQKTYIDIVELEKTVLLKNYILWG